MLEAYKQGLEQEKSDPRLQKIFSNWLDRWWPRHPAFQFSMTLILVIMGLVGGYFLKSGNQSNAALAPLRQEMQSMQQALAISLLHHQSASERLRGVSLSARMETADAEMLNTLLDKLNSDTNVSVRLAVVDALYLFQDHPQVKQGLIDSLARQTSPLVQVSMVDLMVSLRERRAIEALKSLIQKEDLTPEKGRYPQERRNLQNIFRQNHLRRHQRRRGGIHV